MTPQRCFMKHIFCRNAKGKIVPWKMQCKKQYSPPLYIPHHPEGDLASYQHDRDIEHVCSEKVLILFDPENIWSQYSHTGDSVL